MDRRETFLFTAGNHEAVVLHAGDIPRLQRFYEENPEYHRDVGGASPRPDEAGEEFQQMPPADWPLTRKWMLAFEDGGGAIAGSANLLAGLFAADVWHVGLFIVATRLHGSGAARSIYAALEAWMRSEGARWLRLGVVEGNTRAERFWESVGYVEVRKRDGYIVGVRSVTLRVMAKALAGGSLAEYLEHVPRDRPESP